MGEVGRRTDNQGRTAGRRLASDRSGAAAVEYALLASLIAVAIVGALLLTGAGWSNSMNKVEQAERIRVGP